MTPLPCRLQHAWALAGAVLLGAVAGCGSPIVGAECKDGLMLCEGRCVDPGSDFMHCGSCGTDCGDFVCRDAVCTDERRDDPGDRDGGGDGDGDGDGDDRDASVGFGGTGEPFLPDGGFDFPSGQVGSGCGLGQTLCNGACVYLDIDRSHCGECENQCAPDEYCVSGMCDDVCDPPLSLCDNQCVDLETDPRHCGTCRNMCRSGLCIDGVCSDELAGHVVVIGHDYQESRSETVRRIAGNAVFLAQGSPVRALVYEGDATNTTIAGIDAAIDAVVELDGRDWTRRVAEVDLVTQQLFLTTAFVIYPQERATDDELRELGVRWGMSMAQFLLRGGSIVVFETDTSANSGTYKILEPAGLFSAASRERIGSDRLTVVEPGVGVAARTTRDYVAPRETVHFLSPSGAARPIVVDGDGEAVVLHRIVSP